MRCNINSIISDYERKYKAIKKDRSFDLNNEKETREHYTRRGVIELKLGALKSILKGREHLIDILSFDVTELYQLDDINKEIRDNIIERYDFETKVICKEIKGVTVYLTMMFVKDESGELIYGTRWNNYFFEYRSDIESIHMNIAYEQFQKLSCVFDY